MSAATRIGIYAVTGSFFWLTQLLFVVFSATLGYGLTQDWLIAASDLSTQLMNGVPKGLHPTVAGLLTALAILGVFTTGLLLDLLGSTSFYAEMSVLNKNIDLNRGWLDRFVKNHNDYIAEDYDSFGKKFAVIQTWHVQESDLPDRPTQGFFILRLLRWLMLKFRHGRTLYAAYKLIPTYERIQSFLFSFVSAAHDTTDLGLLMEEMRVWRTVRAITVGLALVAFEILIVLALWYTQLLLPAISGEGLWTVISVGWGIVSTLFGFLVYLIIYETKVVPRLAQKSHYSMSLTLFSLVYLTEYKAQADDKNEQIVVSTRVNNGETTSTNRVR